MLLTDAQIHEIRQIIADYHTAFVANYVDPKAVQKEVLDKLKKKGMIKPKVSSVEEAYLYGQVLARMDDPKTAKMPYDTFKEHIRKQPVPLSDIEQRSVAAAYNNAAIYCHGLGNKVNQSSNAIMIEHDAELRRRLQGIIRDKTAENSARRESLGNLKSDLGWASKDWTRDWDRIAITESHNAMQQGVQDSITEKFGDDAMVAKIPMSDACQHCKRLYLGPDGAPRIWKMSDLAKNGHTNYGRKTADWKAVTGSTHPHCQCQLIRIPPGFGFDDDGSLVPGGKLGKTYDSEKQIKKALELETDLYKAFSLQGHVEFQGLDIAIENKAGTKRRWTDAHGNTGETEMLYAYGYVQNTVGADEDEIDVFVGPDPLASQVFIIHQKNPETGIYDEDKVMLGFSNADAAKCAYQCHYDKRDFFATMTSLDIDHFKRLIKLTAPKQGEMFKKDLPQEKFVIGKSLVSEGKLQSTGGAVSGKAANRAPSTGGGFNYQLNTPIKYVPQANAHEIKQVLLEAGEKGNSGLLGDKSDYEFNTPIDKVFVIKDSDLKMDAEDRQETIAHNRHVLDTELDDTKDIPKNYMDPQEH
jgi:hypothetical protein